MHLQNGSAPFPAQHAKRLRGLDKSYNKDFSNNLKHIKNDTNEMHGGVALAGKAGGAIRGRLELFDSFLSPNKKEYTTNKVKFKRTKDFEKVIKYEK